MYTDKYNCVFKYAYNLSIIYSRKICYSILCIVIDIMYIIIPLVLIYVHSIT